LLKNKFATVLNLFSKLQQHFDCLKVAMLCSVRGVTIPITGRGFPCMDNEPRHTNAINIQKRIMKRGAETEFKK